MLFLGLLLLVACAGITLGVVLDNTDDVSASAFGVSLSHVSVGGFFLAGAAIGALALLGLVMMVAGLARKRSRRNTTKQNLRQGRTEKEQLAQENAALRERVSGSYPTGETPVESLPRD